MKKDKLEKAIFIESSQGNPMLMDNLGHIFNSITTRNVDDTKKIYWRCRESNRKGSKGDPCPVKATTRGIHVIKWTEKHNH